MASKTRRARRPTEISVPSNFRCPISLDLMRDPVTLSTGITYDRSSIETWLDMGNLTCPITNQHLPVNGDVVVVPNHALRRMIQDWCVENRSHGIDRIPTPKIPVTPVLATEVLSEISEAVRSGDSARGCELAAKVGTLSKESERNRRCFASAGSARILAALFEQSPSVEILSTMALFSPLDYDTCQLLCSRESLKSLVSILKSGDIGSRLNALMVLKEILAAMNKEMNQLALLHETDGLVEALVDTIKKPISPRATKTALAASYYLISLNDTTASKFVDSGLIPPVLEALLEPDKGLCERALAVLDSLLSYDKGREEACNHALTVPVLVKKMFRVSDLATEFVVSALWKLSKNREILVEAIQVGAFQKVLLLLQVGCNERTKERATELLKMMNGFRERLDCIDSMDFKGLKRAI